MVLKPFIPDASRYDDLLRSGGQIGAGSYGRYIGSNLQNGAGFGSAFRSLGRFFSRHIVPIVSKGKAHALKALEAAKPSLRLAADAVLEEASRKAGEKIADVLAPSTTGGVLQSTVTGTPAEKQQQQLQAGSGYRQSRKRRRKASSPARSVKNKRRLGRKVLLHRVPPYDIPDAF